MTDAERFTIKRVLGKGSFGVVRLADDIILEKEVAIKFPHDDDLERGLRRELRTMDAIRKLRDEHLVRLEQPAYIDGQTVIVMEYMDGGSLRSTIGTIGNQHPIPAETAVNVAMQVCQGIVAVRDNLNLIHRDIKPENILLRKCDELVKIADFGISRILDTSGYASSNAGTLAYMAPEVLEGNHYDYRVDIYCLGITLYEAVVGRLPFSPFDEQGRQKPQKVYINEICAGNPITPVEITGGSVCQELSDIIMRAIACKPHNRYDTAEKVYQDLDQFYCNICVDAAIAEALRESSNAQVEKRLKEIVKRFPRSAKGYLTLGPFYNRQLRFNDALKVFEEGARRCPGSSELLIDLALAFKRNPADLANAVRTLEQLLELEVSPQMEKDARRFLRIWRKHTHKP